MVRTIPQLCASVAGRPSPLGVLIHEAGYRAAGLDFRYVAIGSERLDETVHSLVALGVRGFGVSMPFKADVIELLDSVSPDVQSIGACNTVVNDEGKLTGHNTDWRGAMDALEAAGIRPPGRAVVLGSGGVARALVFGLRDKGWEVAILARNAITGREVADQFELQPPLSFDQSTYPSFDLVVNATPLSEYPVPMLNLERFPDARYIFDVIFSPLKTPLCAEAERRGLRVVRGWEMLLRQAMHQFELYTGVSAPFEVMRDTLVNNLK